MNTSERLPGKLIFAVFFACLAGQGTGRAAFGLIAPFMQADTHFSSTYIGLLAGFELYAYLCGILTLQFLIPVIGLRKITVTGAFIQALALALKGTTTSIGPFFLAHFLAGLGAAWCFIAAMNLLAHRIRDNLTFASALVFGGATGWAALLGLLLPRFNEVGNWHWCWLFLSGINLVAFLILFMYLPHEVLPATDFSTEGRSLWNRLRKMFSVSPIERPIVFSYSLYGFGLGSFLTFLPSHMSSELGYSTAQVGRFWFIAWSLAAFLGPPLGFFARRARGFQYAALLLSLMAISMVVLLNRDLAPLGLCLGVISVGALVPAIAALCSSLDPQRPSNTFARASFYNGVSLLASPVVAGVMRDKFNSHFAGFALCGVLLVGASLILARAAMVRPAQQAEDSGRAKEYCSDRKAF